jgi:hypothetical protein
MLKALLGIERIIRLVSHSGQKDRLRQLEPSDEFQSEEPQRPLTTAFGLMPLVVPHEDSLAELKILNAVYSGLLFEGRSHNSEELGVTRAEFARALRSLKANGAIHTGPGGRYRLSFSTSNFPNITSR